MVRWCTYYSIAEILMVMDSIFSILSLCFRNSIHSSNRLPMWFLVATHRSLHWQHDVFHWPIDLREAPPRLASVGSAAPSPGLPVPSCPGPSSAPAPAGRCPSPAKSSTSWLWWNSVCWILLKGCKPRKSPFLMETMKKSNGHHLQTGDVVNGWLIGTNNDL